jgi:hypothetical protein
VKWLSAKGMHGQEIRFRPEKVYPVIRRHYCDGVVWSRIRVLLPHPRHLIVAERPERLARRIGKALRALTSTGGYA